MFFTYMDLRKSVRVGVNLKMVSSNLHEPRKFRKDWASPQNACRKKDKLRKDKSEFNQFGETKKYGQIRNVETRENKNKMDKLGG